MCLLVNKLIPNRTAYLLFLGQISQISRKIKLRKKNNKLQVK